MTNEDKRSIYLSQEMKVLMGSAKGWTELELAKPGEYAFRDKLAHLQSQTTPVQGNVRTDGEVNYIMPNRAARRRAAKAKGKK